MALNIDIDDIKEFIQDKPELNLLYDNTEQFSDDLYDVILPMVEDEILIQFPSLRGRKIRKTLVMYLVIANLMDSESFTQLRNQVTVSDTNNNGTSLYGKQNSYLQLAQMYRQKAIMLLQSMAKASFYNECWGDVTSNATDMETSNSMYDGSIIMGI